MSSKAAKRKKEYEARQKKREAKAWNAAYEKTISKVPTKEELAETYARFGHPEPITLEYKLKW